MNNLIKNHTEDLGVISGYNTKSTPERVETLIIGGGQAGLSIGYQMAKRNLPFLILDANKRVGDSWRQRWDSLKLFTPSKYCGLAGMPFPGSPHNFPTKDEMGDFLEHYAKHYELPVKNNVRVDHLGKNNNGFILKAGELLFEAENVVVAMSNYQKPKVPAFAKNLDPGINQFHSIEYRNPSQLKDGDILIVGAGNSGSEIGMEVAKTHQVYMSGRNTGEMPFNIHSRLAKLIFIPLVLRIFFHRLMTIHTMIGQKMRKMMLSQGGPLIRVKHKKMKAVGIKLVPKVAGVKDGLPLLEDGRIMNVKNVIWCTGFHPGFSWINLPVLGEKEPDHVRGVVYKEPGLYFLGLHFLYAASSSMVQGLERDARHIVTDIIERKSKSEKVN